MAPAVLETHRLSMSYPGTRALDDVSVSFQAGRVEAIVGRNGAGKSTLVKILSGAVRPTGGEIRLDGSRVSLRSPAEARARGIATVHQELSLIPGLSAAENVLLGRFPRRRGLARVAVDWGRLFEEARRILDGMDVRIDARAPVARLPLAQRQMIEIARAVSSGARAVLFDEPTAGLARDEARTLFRLVRGLCGKGVAVVYVTHHLGEIAEIADTVTALRDGKVAATIPAKEASAAALVEMMYGPEGAAHERTAADLRSDDLHDPARESPPVLEVEKLGLGETLRDVSFTLRRGEILGIAGLLGSGRTELLMALFGARRADRGWIVVRGGGAQGRDVRLAAARGTPARMCALGLALVPEDRKSEGLVLGLSTLDNLCLAELSGAAADGAAGLPGSSGFLGFLSRARQRRAVRPVVDELDIHAADLDAPVAVLSGGNQQKVVLGKWLLRSPRVLLCDEPTRGIDVRAKAQVFEALRGLARRGIASIVVSSELEEVLEVAHRILVLRGGTIACEKDPRALTLDRLLALCMGGAERR